MSERMTDEHWFTIRNASWSKSQQGEVRREMDRARGAEDAISTAHADAMGEIAVRDSTINALADALLRNGFWVDGGKDWHSRRCPQSLPPAGAPCTCPDDRIALRLAGRLP